MTVQAMTAVPGGHALPDGQAIHGATHSGTIHGATIHGATHGGTIHGATIPDGQTARGGQADVVYVMGLLQGGFVVLAGLGELLLMHGNPLYLVLPVAKAVLLGVFAGRVVAGRRWAMVALIVVEGVTLVGFWLQVLAGLLPFVDFTVNLVGLITGVAMPLAVIYLCDRMIATTPRPGKARPAVSPYPAMMTTTWVVGR
ncbi:MAG: hypothetical protein ACM30G_05510 [Micromonosporaceae bacterium]